MFIITRNGSTTVLTGWRAWLAGAALLLAAWLLLAGIAFFAIGAAITFGVVLLLFVPAAIVAGLIGSSWSRR